MQKADKHEVNAELINQLDRDYFIEVDDIDED